MSSPKAGDGQPLRALKEFAAVELGSGEQKALSFTLDKEAFVLYNQKGEKVPEQGEYTVYIGGSQPDERSVELLGRSPLQTKVVL